jgi:hypothetical protein
MDALTEVVVVVVALYIDKSPGPRRHCMTADHQKKLQDPPFGACAERGQISGRVSVCLYTHGRFDG